MTLSATPTRLLGSLSLVIGLAGCASAPEVRFHSLLPADTPVASVVPVPSLGLVIAAVKVPPAVDQPQWLVRRLDNTLQALEQERWAAPLGDEFRAALRDGLRRRWGLVDGSVPVAATPPVAPAWRLMLEVLRLDARPGSDTLLEARWSLVPPRAGAATLTCDFAVREAVSGDGTVPLAQAHRRAVVSLTDQIGRQLRALAGGAAGSCSDLPA